MHVPFLNAAPLTSCTISVLLSSFMFSSTVGGGMGELKRNGPRGKVPCGSPYLTP